MSEKKRNILGALQRDGVWRKKTKGAREQHKWSERVRDEKKEDGDSEIHNEKKQRQ